MSEALQISFKRPGLVVPTIGCICAGWRRIHAIAMAVFVTPLGRRNRVDFLVEFGELFVIQEYALEEAVLEWRPGLNGNIIQAAIIQNAAVPVDGGVDFHVNVDARIDHAGVGDAELKLVEEELLLDEFSQQLDLHGVLVADPKIPHLAAVFQRMVNASATSSGSTRASGRCSRSTSRYTRSSAASSCHPLLPGCALWKSHNCPCECRLWSGGASVPSGRES